MDVYGAVVQWYKIVVCCFCFIFFRKSQKWQETPTNQATGQFVSLDLKSCSNGGGGTVPAWLTFPRKLQAYNSSKRSGVDKFG